MILRSRKIKVWQNLITLRSGDSFIEFNNIELWRKFDRIKLYWVWDQLNKLIFLCDLGKAWKTLIILRSEKSLTEFIILRSGKSLAEFNYIEIWRKIDRI